MQKVSAYLTDEGQYMEIFSLIRLLAGSELE